MVSIKRRALLGNFAEAVGSIQPRKDILQFENVPAMYRKLNAALEFAILDTDIDDTGGNGTSVDLGAVIDQALRNSQKADSDKEYERMLEVGEQYQKTGDPGVFKK